MGAKQSQPVQSVPQSTADDRREDTVTLAKLVREKQGPYEVEVTCGDEADLHRHLKTCEKNPGHQKFIPVNEFTMEHLTTILPCYHGYYHNEEVMNLIRAMSDLTVRVTVNYVSDKRPHTWPDSDEIFPGYDDGPKNIKRVGTGYVKRVTMNSELLKKNKETCTCKECCASPSPKTDFAEIVVVTAVHVVYDDLEAEHTTCHLFFDNGGTPEACSGVFTLDHMSSLRCDTGTDWCEMTYATHDPDLIKRLCLVLSRMKKFRVSQVVKYSRSEVTMKGLYNRVEDEPLTVIVSHPHGCSKQISLGYCTDAHEKLLDKKQYKYTTATCPGSSGARVLVLQTEFFSNRKDFVHSGSHKKYLNYCKFIDRNIAQERALIKKLRVYGLNSKSEDDISVDDDDCIWSFP